MNKGIFNFLKSYSCGVLETNRLIVTSFLNSNNISLPKNRLINSLLITNEDDDFSNFQAFNQLYKISSFEDLITAFEFVISPEEKVVTGAVYTPKIVREFIVTNALKKNSLTRELSVCDIACGCGGFLFSSAMFIKEKMKLSYSEVFSKHLFGIDLMDYSIERSRILLSLLAITEGEDKKKFDFNLFVGNSLEFDFTQMINNFIGFDAVIGNPPYVCSRNIDEHSKSLLQNWPVSSTGHPDLYIPFFEIGLKFLKKSGYLGYITMNSFFKSLNGRALRSFFKDRQYNFTILDFGDLQVFNSRSTYTCICLIQNLISDSIFYKKLSSINNLSMTNLDVISYDNLNDHNGWNLRASRIVNKIESVGTPFHKIFKTSSGIATLKNSIFIFDFIKEDHNYFYLESGAKLEKQICIDIVNPNKLIMSNDLEKLKKKIIFPYRYPDTGVAIIPEKELKSLYPNVYAYLKSHKELLATRDKGKGNYIEWFAYGRGQGLEKYDFKLLFPHISPVIPNYVLTNDRSLLFHNGQALLSNDKNSLKLAQKIMQSKLFWFYIVNTSKPYGSGYLSLSRNYLKSFGIYDFTDEQKSYVINENDQSKVDIFLENLYEINL